MLCLILSSYSGLNRKYMVEFLEIVSTESMAKIVLMATLALTEKNFLIKTFFVIVDSSFNGFEISKSAKATCE